MCNTIPDRSPRPTLQVQCESPQMNSLDSEQMNELNEWQERNLPNENMVGNASVEVPALDPVQVSIKEKEERLAKELQAWEENLVSERLSLLRARDKMFDSGKNAYYSVQAQVNDFMVCNWARKTYFLVNFVHLSLLTFVAKQRCRAEG